MDKEKAPKIPERWHGAHHYSNRLHIFFVLFLVFSALAILWSYFALNKIGDAVSKHSSYAPSPSVFPSSSPTHSAAKPGVPAVGACTMEAKVCPDGINFVGRSGATCQFQACPGEHCGGFIKDPKTCLNRYHCELNSRVPDLGGTCVKD